MNEIINLIREDIIKAKERLNAFEQECNIEGIAFNKGTINALECVLMDIKLKQYRDKGLVEFQTIT
jgi:hypothetical protein